MPERGVPPPPAGVPSDWSTYLDVRVQRLEAWRATVELEVRWLREFAEAYGPTVDAIETAQATAEAVNRALDKANRRIEERGLTRGQLWTAWLIAFVTVGGTVANIVLNYTYH